MDGKKICGKLCKEKFNRAYSGASYIYKPKKQTICRCHNQITNKKEEKKTKEIVKDVELIKPKSGKLDKSGKKYIIYKAILRWPKVKKVCDKLCKKRFNKKYSGYVPKKRRSKPTVIANSRINVNRIYL